MFTNRGNWVVSSLLAAKLAAVGFSLGTCSSVAPATPPATAPSPRASLTINVAHPGTKFGPLFYGLMTEEINYSYDGGLYGELIHNRIFRNPLPAGSAAAATESAPALPPPPPTIPHWSFAPGSSSSATLSLDTTNPINATALTTNLKLDMRGDAGEHSGIANDGYWGIPVKPNTTYTASFYAKASPDFSGPLTVSINSDIGNAALAAVTTEKIGTTWKKHTVLLRTGPNAATSSTNKFVISAEGTGTLWFNLVSLFPPTYKNRANGNRIDLMEKMADLHPKFLRFPGGNYIEGNDLANRFDWKKTIGPLEERAGHMSPWNYRSSDGLGLLEFLNWCEDLNIEPVLALFDGLTLRNPNPGTPNGITGDALKPYIQEALEEIEYVTGDTTTTWGARRAKDGHPGPFKLTYVEIGNEDNLSGGTTTHDERFGAFFDAIKAKYPKLQVIASATGGLRTHKPDVQDEHYYFSGVQAAINGSNRYDNRTQYPLDGTKPKVFVGEWATRLNDPVTRRLYQTPNMQDALADALFLTGLERNPETIIMACYAPMFVNVNPGAQQWPTDLIGYDANSSFGSVSYYGQKMFYNNLGDVALPRELGVAGNDVFASASRDTAAGEVIIKLVNNRETAAPVDITLAGAKSIEKNGSGWLLTGALSDVNTITEPTKIVPREITIDNAAEKFTCKLPGHSIVVLRLKVK